MIFNEKEATKSGHMSIGTLFSHQHLTSTLSGAEAIESRIIVIVDKCNFQNQEALDALEKIFEGAFAVILFSRSNVLPECLSPESFLKFELVPFSILEVRNYIGQFLKINYSRTNSELWDIDGYVEILEKLPDVQNLCKNVRLLSFIIPLLPTIITKNCDLNKLAKIQAKIFDSITEQWFECHSMSMCHFVGLSELDFQIYCRVYSQNLALKSIERKGFLNDDFWTESQTLKVSLLEPAGNMLLMNSWGEMRKIFEQNSDFVSAIRDSCLLRLSNWRYSFYSRPLCEYFGSKELTTNLVWVFNSHMRDVQNNADAKSVSKYALKQLCEKVTTDQEFSALLLKIVQKSAETPGLGALASRAMTILNASRYNFSGQDFRNIIIPQANLTNSVCANTDLRGANLDGVNFTGSYLAGTRFEGANLSYTNFGEELQVKTGNMGTELSRLVYFVTPLGNVRLLYFYKLVEKTRRGPVNLNHKIGVQELNFDTGSHVKSYCIERYTLSCFHLKIIRSKYVLLIWKPLHPFNITYDSFNTLKLSQWDLRTGKFIVDLHFIRWFTCPTNPNCKMELKIDDRGRWIAMSQDNEICVSKMALNDYDQSPNQFRYTLLENVKLRDFEFSPSEDWLAILTSHGLIRLTVQLQNSSVYLNNEFVVYGSLRECDAIMKIDSHSKYIAARNGMNVVKLYNVSTGRIFKLSLKTDWASLTSCDFNFDSSLLATGDSCANVIIWSTKNGRPCQIFSRDDSQSVDICFHPETNLLSCSMAYDSTLKFWNIDESLTIDSNVQETDEFSHGNIIQLTMTFDQKYVGSLYFHSIQPHNYFGEPNKRKISLNIWNVETKATPVTVFVGTILGKGLAFDSSHSTNSFFVVCTLIYYNDPTAIFHCPEITGELFADPLALVYDFNGNLLYKQQLRHDTFKGVDGFVYRSVLSLNNPSRENIFLLSYGMAVFNLGHFQKTKAFLNQKFSVYLTIQIWKTVDTEML